MAMSEDLLWELLHDRLTSLLCEVSISRDGRKDADLSPLLNLS
jgi:hypothetical protein